MNRKHPTDPVNILLVEDNPGDVHLTLEALKDIRIRNRVEVVADGEAAIRYLHGEEGFGDRVRPDLILLDLNLPRRDGHEVLEDIRRHPGTQTIPVVILTSSERDTDVDRSYGLRANCYVTKPIGVTQFLDAVRDISRFWFETVRLPGEGSD